MHASGELEEMLEAEALLLVELLDVVRYLDALGLEVFLRVRLRSGLLAVGFGFHAAGFGLTGQATEELMGQDPLVVIRKFCTDNRLCCHVFGLYFAPLLLEFRVVCLVSDLLHSVLLLVVLLGEERLGLVEVRLDGCEPVGVAADLFAVKSRAYLDIGTKYGGVQNASSDSLGVEVGVEEWVVAVLGQSDAGKHADNNDEFHWVVVLYERYFLVYNFNRHY